MPNAISIAIEKDDLGGVQRFLDDKNINEEIDGFSPLERAVLHGRIEIAEYLLKNGADINVNNRQILVYAVRSVREFNNPLPGAHASPTDVVPMVKLLLGWGADPNGRQEGDSFRFDPDKRSALHYAVWIYATHCDLYEEVIKDLLGAGADKRYIPIIPKEGNQSVRQTPLDALLGLSFPRQKALSLFNPEYPYPNIRHTAKHKWLAEKKRESKDIPVSKFFQPAREHEAAILITVGIIATGLFLKGQELMDDRIKLPSLVIAALAIAMILIKCKNKVGREISDTKEGVARELTALSSRLQKLLEEFSKTTKTTGDVIRIFGQSTEHITLTLTNSIKGVTETLQGEGKKVCEDLREGIKQGKFKPEVTVTVQPELYVGLVNNNRSCVIL